MTDDRQSGLNLAKEVFRAGLEAFAERPLSEAERLESLERLRNALFEALQSGPVDTDPLMKVKLRAIIAAGFEAAVEDVEKERGVVSSSEG
ncbi:hypothetical protein [Roseomonas chloroacetimidivorans]|uniref:hypothetical protein n=1 Tax=Roseomonas chloroacetimidivorans TaxID=1766656 RepID=UPI003C780485